MARHAGSDSEATIYYFVGTIEFRAARGKPLESAGKIGTVPYLLTVLIHLPREYIYVQVRAQRTLEYDPPVATKAAQTFLGTFGAKFVTATFLLSTMGALQGVILVKARIPFAMARDGLFFSTIGTVSKRTSVPVRAIGIEAAWASVLAATGSFDQLTDFVIFAAWIFYGLTAVSVFRLRHKMPYAPRPYRTLGYPVVPLIFVLVALWLIINTLQTSPVESAMGLLLILLGLPLYYYFQRKQKAGKVATI